MPECPTEARPLAEAYGAILREPIRADRDQPPFDRVTMDGIAVAYDAWAGGRREFAIAGVQRAGEPAKQSPGPEACLEVMTGAMLPDGTDCVVRIEDVTVEGDTARVHDEAALTKWNFVHAEGTDAKAGDAILEPGVRMTPTRIAVAAAFGAHMLAVTKPPSVAIVSTGDELVEAHETPQPHQIRLSNVYAIEAGLRMRGFVNVERRHLPDDKDRIRSALAELLERFDVVLLTGGVSMGKFDFVPETLKALGVEQHFHKVAQRPGKPLWFGVAPGGKPVFGLPGNPASAVVCFRRYVLHHVEKAMGLVETPEIAALAEPIDFIPDLTYFLPVALSTESGAVLTAKPLPTNTSGDFGTLGHSDAIIELPRDGSAYPAGFTAPIYRWA